MKKTNELAILLHLLSKKGVACENGATKSEILDALNVKGKNRSVYFHNIMSHLDRYLEPLGLQIRFNPINSCWFTSFDSEVSDLIAANPFEGKPRLAATLFCTLSVCMKNNGIATLKEIKELRKKENLLDDLKDLEHMGYIGLKKETNQVSLTPLIGYQLDLEKLFVKLALKLKQNES